MASQINLNLTSHGTGRIEVDGVDMSSAVCGVELKSHVGSGTEVTLHLASVNGLTGEFDASVGLPDKARDALIRLGWAPPGVGIRVATKDIEVPGGSLTVSSQMTDDEINDLRQLFIAAQERGSGARLTDEDAARIRRTSEQAIRRSHPRPVHGDDP